MLDCLLSVASFTTKTKDDANLRQSPGQVQRKLLDLIDSGLAETRRLGVDVRDIDLGRFAIVAYVDEMMSTIQWEGSKAWSNYALQNHYYSTGVAGEEFYYRLGQIGKGNDEILEVYYACLLLGFKGKYSRPDDKSNIDRIKHECVKRFRQVNSFNRGKPFPLKVTHPSPTVFMTSLIRRYSVAILFPLAAYFICRCLLLFQIDNIVV